MADSPAATSLAGLEKFLQRSPEETCQGLESFAALLQKWQPAQNLVSRETLDNLWSRHVRDSLQVLQHLTGAQTRFLDVGSGGGFPALPLAIALRGNANFVLVEANRRKCAFLRTVVRELRLPAKVLDKRAEMLDRADVGPIDVVTCRATAPLGRLFNLTAHLISPTTRLLLHKGREYGEELAQADADWDMHVVVLPSLADSEGVLLDITHLKRKPA